MERSISKHNAAKKPLQKNTAFCWVIMFFLAATLFLSDTPTKYFFDYRNNFKKNNKKIVTSSKVSKEENNIYSKVFTKPEISKPTKQQVPHKTIISIAGSNQVNKQYTVPARLSSVKHRFLSAKKVKKSADKTSVNSSTGSIEETVFVSTETRKKMLKQPQIINSLNQILKQTFHLNIDTSGVNNLTKITRAKTIYKPADTTKAITKITKNKTGKWLLGITFTGGFSATGNGYFNSNTSQYNYQLLSANPGTGAGSANNYTASKLKPGIGLVAGFSAAYRLTNKSNFVTGLNYKLFTTSITANKNITAAGNINFSIGNAVTYKNSFHFIEVPLLFQTQVNPLKKHALYFETGLSFSQLISSNTLQFSSAQGNYYNDNSLFHKTIIGLSAGLSINLLSSKKAMLLLGPQLYYSATSLSNTGFYTKTHYSFAGIKLQKSISKN